MFFFPAPFVPCVFFYCVIVRFLFGGGREDCGCGCGSTWTAAGVVLLLLLCWTARAFLSVHLHLLLLLLAMSARPDVLLPLRAMLFGNLFYIFIQNVRHDLFTYYYPNKK